MVCRMGNDETAAPPQRRLRARLRPRQADVPAPRTYPTLATAMTAFGTSLVAKSPRTAENYQSALGRFSEYLRDQGTDPLSYVNP